MEKAHKSNIVHYIRGDLSTSVYHALSALINVGIFSEGGGWHPSPPSDIGHRHLSKYKM